MEYQEVGRIAVVVVPSFRTREEEDDEEEVMRR